MLNIFCNHQIACEGTDYPVANYSAEAPDKEIFIGLNWGWGDPPPLGQDWTTSWCYGQVLSTVSQEDADLRAAQLALLCTTTPAEDGEGGTGPGPRWTTYGSQQAYCISNCPDGSPFTYIVLAGAFFGTSQLQADRMALSYACRQAAQLKVCLADLSPAECCIDTPYLARLRASGVSTAPNSVQWMIVAGRLPNGIQMDSSTWFTVDGSEITFSGTPTESGTFPFTIRVTDTLSGFYMQKTFTLCVVDIAPATLPNGTVGTAYSQTLTATACAQSPLSWQVSAGALPAGLTLDETTGVISGTPTTAGTYAFRITLQTQAT